LQENPEMRRLALVSIIALTFAIPLYAGKGQSYFTYDDGGTIIKQGDDGHDVDARVNLPVFAGDEVVTSRRGRSEIRLSDGNVIALDRSTDVRFKSILDSYDGEGAQTVVDLRYGHIAVQRTEFGREYLRVDSDSASYVAVNEAIYSVDSDRGTDRVIVFDGAVEVRTPNRTQRVRAGEQAKVDGDGMYDVVSESQYSADDFERWYLRRAERYGHGSSRYLDRSLAYADYDLGQNGSWIYVNGFSTWCWRPNVAVGWRPYYNGEWGYGRGGSLIWISYEPWGWVPYHYGRWAFDSSFGWVWLPGTGYSPAWVYWMYGPNYVGWAPAGWWEGYRPYYDWCYRPYARANFDYALWFFGHTRVTDIDLRPWTFVQPHGLVATRIDRGALSTDLVRERVLRGGSGDAVITNNPARFTRNDLRDPAGAINNIVRRGHEGGSGSTDVTPFIRRDPDLSTGVRDRIARTNPNPGNGGVATIGSGGVAPVRGGGGVAPIGGGSVAPIGAGSPSPIVGDRGGDHVNRGGGGVDRGGRRNDETGNGPSWRDSNGVVRRGEAGNGEVTVTAPAPRDSNGSTPAPGWRDHVNRGERSGSGDNGPTTTAPSTTQAPTVVPRDEWRQRPSRGGDTPAPAPVPRTNAPAETPKDRGSRGDIARRIIDAIGGARVSPGDGGRSSSGGHSSSGGGGSSTSGGSSSSGGSGSHSSSPPPQPAPSSPPPSRDSGSHDHVSRDKP